MDAPETLIRRLAQGRVVPFVGAGVSMAVRGKDGKGLFSSRRDLLLHGADRLASEVGEAHGQLVRLLLALDADFLGAARRLRDQPLSERAPQRARWPDGTLPLVELREDKAKPWRLKL